jgi:sulfotransferase family protein
VSRLDAPAGDRHASPLVPAGGPSIDPARLVFVGGLHRSGTTLFADLLAGHPDVSGLSDTGVWEDEGQHLQDVYPAADRFGGPGRFAFAPAAHLTEDSDLVSERSRERLLSAWAPYWDTSRRLLVEKSPPNLIRFRFLQALFPGARLVAVIRHPVPVTYATHRFYRKLHRRPQRPTIQRLLDHWATAHEIFRRDLSSLDDVIVVRYEELTDRPMDVLARVADDLGLEPDFARSAEAVERSRSERYFDAWRRYLSRPVVGPMRRRRASALDERVRAWGYELLEDGPTEDPA